MRRRRVRDRMSSSRPAPSNNAPRQCAKKKTLAGLSRRFLCSTRISTCRPSQLFSLCLPPSHCVANSQISITPANSTICTRATRHDAPTDSLRTTRPVPPSLSRNQFHIQVPHRRKSSSKQTKAHYKQNQTHAPSRETQSYAPEEMTMIAASMGLSVQMSS